MLNTRERRQLRLFVRRDTYGRYLSCLVYLPRDRYTTAVRERIAEILKRQLHGDSIEYTARVSEVGRRAAASVVLQRASSSASTTSPSSSAARRGGPFVARRLWPRLAGRPVPRRGP